VDIDEAGRQRMAIGKAHLRSNVTAAESTITFAVLHLGDHNLLGGVRDFQSDEAFKAMQREIKEAFARSDLTEIIRLMDKHFDTHNYSLWHLFRDEQRKVWNRILETTIVEVEGSFQRIYDHHYPIMLAMRELHTPIPKALVMTAGFTINADLRKAVEADTLNLDQLQDLVAAVQRWGFDVDKTTLGFVASRKVRATMEQLDDTPEDTSLLEGVETMLKTLEPLGLEYNLWKTKNILFYVGRRMYGPMRERAEGGDEAAANWIEKFDSLSRYMQVRSY
jgi:Domain of unknown function (DUF3536)